MKNTLLGAGLAAVLLLITWSLFSLAMGPFPSHAYLGLLVLLAVLLVVNLRYETHHGKIVSKVHFPGLNALRFLAAFFVLIYHTDQGKMINGLDSFQGGDSHSFLQPFFYRAGALGVSFFFVLSGFLITYLLLAELRDTGSICVKQFYARRALRIWPVYFLLTAFSFTILPRWQLVQPPGMMAVLDKTFWPKLSLYFLMLVHVCNNSYPGQFPGGVLWTASVEEQFYFLWPWIIRLLKKGAIFAFIAIIPIVIILKITLALWCLFFGINYSPETFQICTSIGEYFQSFRIDCMAIGGFGAWLCIYKSPYLHFLFHWTIQLFVAAIFLFILLVGLYFPMFDDDIYAFLFLVVILNVAVNPRSLLKLEFPILDFLGRLSYGLYAYSWLSVNIAINLMLKFGVIQNIYLRNFYIYGAVFVILLCLSTASYYLMEQKFLRMKVHFGSLSSAKISKPSDLMPASKAAGLARFKKSRPERDS